MANDPKHSPAQSEYQNPSGCLIRLFWMGGGNLALVLIALWIYRSAGWSLRDLLFGVIVLLLVVARYVDIVRFHGQTADAEGPATMTHWKRYSLTLVAIAVTLWAVARVLGPGFSV